MLKQYEVVRLKSALKFGARTVFNIISDDILDNKNKAY